MIKGESGAAERRTADLTRASHLAGADSSFDEIRVRLDSLEDIVTARQQARHCAARLGFSKTNLTLIATAISEIARNAVQYGADGEVVVTPITNGTRKGVKIVVSDQGPGIADILSVMQDGYSTSNRLGIGLPGTRRLMDEFEIESEIGKGTVVTMRKWTS